MGWMWWLCALVAMLLLLLLALVTMVLMYVVGYGTDLLRHRATPSGGAGQTGLAAQQGAEGDVDLGC